MYKASVVGIDGSGKGSVVRSLEEIDGVGTIHTFSDYSRGDSGLARVSGRLAARLAQFGEQHEAHKLTGGAYLLHLVPYFFEKRAKRPHQLLVNDRDPTVDPLINSDEYLSENSSRRVKKILRPSLKLFYGYPELFIYLEVNPKVAIERIERQGRNRQRQLHETLESLTNLKNLYDREMSRLEDEEGIAVVKIDTNPPKLLDEVIEEVKGTLRLPT